jgi:4-amino-4-deoxy-L-arabinose transferase-like glycosyltransferase
LLILLIGIVVFIPFLGEVHLFDWDEINFAEAAREMLLTNNFQDVQIGFKVFTEKPPFFFWMQALSMHYFGVNEFAARLPNAIIGIITLLVIYQIGKRLKDEMFGVLWVLVYISSFLPHLYFKTGLIDPTFNLFIFLGIYFITLLTENDEFYYRKNKKLRRIKLITFSAFFIGLAVLTKGPVGLLLYLLTFVFYTLYTRFVNAIAFGEIIWFSFVFILTIFPWYGIGFYENGPSFIHEFYVRNLDLLRTKDAGHGGPFYYHFVVLLLGCFPASVLMFGGMRQHKFATDLLQNFQKWMIALLVIVLLVFSVVQTKIVHYSSMAYFPITFFAAYFTYYYLADKKRWQWYHNTLLLFIGIVWGVAITLVPLIGFNPEIVVGFIKDQFAAGNLQAKVFWSNWEALYGLAYILALIIAANLFYAKNKRIGLAFLFISSALIIEVVLIFFTPRIEKYTQAAPIAFYESKQNEDCFISVLDFKSYAHFYYAKMQAEDCIYTNEELLTMQMNKPVYFVSKNIHKEKLMQQFAVLEVLYEENGFVFYKKKTL